MFFLSMHLLIQPLFGDLIVDGLGSIGLMFVLFLMLDAWLQKRQNHQLDTFCKQARQQYRKQDKEADSGHSIGAIPLHQRGAMNGPVRIFNWKFAFLAGASMVAIMLVKGNEKLTQPEAAPQQSITADQAPASTVSSGSSATPNLWDANTSPVIPHGPLFDVDGAHLWEAYAKSDSSQYTAISGVYWSVLLSGPSGGGQNEGFITSASASQPTTFVEKLNAFSR